MQKLIQRTARAEKGAQRQLMKLKERNQRARDWTRKQQDLRRLRAMSENIREARKNRREDWETGALAPRRDVGEKAERYGTMSTYEMNLTEVQPQERLKWWHIRDGDRVVVIRGREKGRIGMVWRTSKRRNSVEVNDINVADFFVPEWVPRPEGDNRSIVGHSQALRVEDVRLVFPLPDPETGLPKDVVIDNLVPVWRGKGEHVQLDRRIDGTDIVIPWPEKPDEETEDHEADTTRIGGQTFQPQLLRAPMPESVIDELRNKYSKFRTRHDWDFLQKMKKIDEDAERRKESPKTMRTPLQELADLRARQKAAQSKDLTYEQLAKIGEVIMHEQSRATNVVKALGR